MSFASLRTGIPNTLAGNGGMDSLIYLTGSRMNGLVEALDATAGNMANANTPGYKRTQGNFESILQVSLRPLAQVSETGDISLHWPELSDWHLDTSQGPIRSTGRPMDLAVDGGAFLVLDTMAGERYTRRGRMYVNHEGELTDPSGNRFVGGSGSLRIPSDAADVTVSKDGEITVDGQSIGKLRLVEVPDAQSLVPEGAGIYRNDGEAVADASTSRIVQGAIEESNVKPMEEIIGMMKMVSAYEAGARLLKRWDSLSQQLIQTAA